MNRLSYANVGDASRSIDWAAAQGEDLEGVRLVLPTITREVLDEYAPELLSDWDACGDDDDDRQDVRDAFEEGDGCFDWKDSLWPMMNFYWPVHLNSSEGESEDAIAARVRAWGGCVTLVEITPEGDDSFHALALTGGGMDLSWNLAAAFLACGNVPPHALLSGLPNYGDLRSTGIPLDVARRIIAEAIPAAAEWLELRASRLREVGARFAEESTDAQ